MGKGYSGIFALKKFEQALVFTCFSKTSVGKGEIDGNEQFLFPTVFYPFGEHSTIFTTYEIVVCRLSLEESKIYRLGKGFVKKFHIMDRILMHFTKPNNF